MPKIHHEVTVNGQKFTRNSAHRVYSHAVVVYYPNVTDGNKLIVEGWTSTEALAQAKATTLRNRQAKLPEGPWKVREVKVVPNGGSDAFIAYDVAQEESANRVQNLVAQALNMVIFG